MALTRCTRKPTTHGFAALACIFVSLGIGLSPALADDARMRGTKAPIESQGAERAGIDDNPLRGTVLGFAAPKLSSADRLATLEAIQLVLDEVGDGSSYLWHRQHGRLSGLIRAESSFYGPAEAVCRRLRVTLMYGPQTKTMKTVACRGTDGRWSFDG
ncbi:MAG: hypothetical protein AAFO62_02065 [Pseudomonadota bacterium]